MGKHCPFNYATTIRELAASPLLETLSGPQLVILLRIVALTAASKKRKMRIRNADLYRDARTTSRVLRELEELGLLRIVYDGVGRIARTIEVV